MGTTLTLAAATSLSVIALGIAVLSLMIQWGRGQQHPDVTAVQREITSVRTELLDLMDKVEHWRKRDNVRAARAGKEAAEQAGAEPDMTSDRQAWKAAMRKRLQSG